MVTLACGEPQLEANRRAVAAQDYPVSMHHVIENLPNLEAHRACYEYIMDNSDRYDIFVPLPGDVVLKNSQTLSEIVSLFNQNSELDHLTLPIRSVGESVRSGELEAYSNRVSWKDPRVSGLGELQAIIPGQRLRQALRRDIPSVRDNVFVRRSNGGDGAPDQFDIYADGLNLTESKTDAEIVAVTGADGKHVDMARYLRDNVADLGVRHIVYDLGGLGFGERFDGKASERPFQNIECKPLLILDALDKVDAGDFVLWLDADTDLQKPPAPLQGSYDLGLALRRSKSANPKELWINAGVMLVRNSPQIRPFLSEWARRAAQVGGDQFALNQLMFAPNNWEVARDLLKGATVRGFRCEDINNFYFDDTERDAFIRHFKADVRSRHPLFTSAN